MKRMKKFTIIHIFTIFLCINSLYAQTPKWISTEVQNRVAVLENFTSIYSNLCAEGDKVANLIEGKNPDKFIIINNHCNEMIASQIKSYHIDLTTEEGSIIYNNAGGYKIPPDYLPAGSLNRLKNPWVMARDKWQNEAEYIMNQKSIVNVYVKPELNVDSRELTVEVEYYYTSDAHVYYAENPIPTNYLTVMLLQNEIIGYQTEGKKYNPDYAINDTLYRHNHVLRKIISNNGAWGDPITNTKKGNYGYKKYTVILPDSIKNVPLDLTKLEVAAFIAADASIIYSGHKAAVEIKEDIKTDLSLEDITEYHSTLKFETFQPKFKITNISDLPVTKFDITFGLERTKAVLYYNSSKGLNSIYKKQKYDTILTKINTYSGLLNKGESAIIEFPEITRDDIKTSSMYITKASISNIYSNDDFLFDIDIKNNSTETTRSCLLDTLFSETEITFENPDTASNDGLIPDYILLDYSHNSYFSPIQGYFDEIFKFSGANNTKASLLFLLKNIYNIQFKPGYIILGEIDCKKNPNKIISFYYAYSEGIIIGTRPRVSIEISKDYGKTWQKISEIFCEETGKLSGYSEIYGPTSAEYKFVQINLYDYVKENFILRIGGIPGANGNALYIDEISITNGPYDEGIEEKSNIAVYPNPATDMIHIKNNNLLGEEYEIYDMSGKLIIKDINNSNTINVEQLSTGTYSLKIKRSIFNFIKE